MKLKQGFKLRSVAGEYIVSAEGLELFDFNKLISLNPSAAYLWQEVEGREFDETDIAELLIGKYHISQEEANNGASGIINKWIEAGLVEL